MLSFLLLSLASAQASLTINQNFSTDLYLEYFAHTHMNTVEEYLNKQLLLYNCIGGNLTSKVLKPMETVWFGNDKPGIIRYNFQAYCQDDNITGFQFGYDPAGYDEDYTQIAFKITTKTAVIKKDICIYATRYTLIKCPQVYGELNRLSVPAK